MSLIGLILLTTLCSSFKKRKRKGGRRGVPWFYFEWSNSLGAGSCHSGFQL